MKKRILNIKGILTDSFEMIYEAAIYLLLFEIIYKGLILILFKPVLNIIVSLFIRAKGYEILVNGEVAQFFLSFTGIFMLIILMSVSVAIVYYEFTVILLILDSTKKKKGIKLLEITERALVKLKNVINKRNIGLSLYIFVLIPILNIGIQSSLLPTISIPDFITGELSKYPGSEILLILVGLILVYLFAKLFIVLPIMILGDKSFRQASKSSFKTIKGEGLQIAFLLIISMLLWLIITYLPFMIFENVEFILLRIFRGLSNISMTIFTLLISPFILSISIGTYNEYIQYGDIKRVDLKEEIKLGYIGKQFWNILEKVFEIIQNIILKVKKHTKIFIPLLLIIIVGVNIYSEESIQPIYDKQLLIGHRGGEYGVENTIDTIIYAGVNGADYVEMDILLTQDNVPVVIHDNSLKRLANLSQDISYLTLAEVKGVTIKGSGKESFIPTLEELAREVKGNTKLLLEFKTHGKEKASIVDITIDILEQEGILDETIFHTSEYDVIEEFNEKYPELSMGYVFIGKLGTFSAKKMANLPVDFISAEESLIDKKMIREVYKAEKAVFAWTINDDYKAERLLELGVDGIITDYPVEMVELRDRYQDYNEINK